MGENPANRETDFGFRNVPLADKQDLVDDVFRKVARRYDLMNDLMSGGLHRAWKAALVTAINPPRQAQAFRLRATVLDASADMLQVGRERAQERGLDDVVSFVEGNAEHLPFADSSYDAVSIAFGMRNVPRIERALGEVFRVLKPLGHFLCLEFSAVDVPGLDRLYDVYSFRIIPALGRAVVGDAEPYRYLVESIRRFPRPKALATMLRGAGLRRVSHRRMSGGIVALHSGWRL